jgi:hypothetical protein
MQIIILPAVLCGCEIWPLTLRKEHRLRVFKNRVLRKYWTEERRSDRRLEKTAYEELRQI